MSFRERFTLAQRCTEFRKISPHLKERIPIIVERGSVEAPVIDKVKFLLPHDVTIAQFHQVIRRRLDLDKNKALFFVIGGTIAPSHANMKAVYDANAAEDGFLYVNYTLENTFG